MTTPDTNALDRVRRYCDEWDEWRGPNPTIDGNGDARLTLADLRAVVRMASEGVR